MQIIVTAIALCASIIASDVPPSYQEPQSPFLATFSEHNVQKMLEFAENSAQNHLEKWAMVAAATAYEDDGAASFWLARRLSKGALETVASPELDDGPCMCTVHVLLKRYLEQATRLNHKGAIALYCDLYHDVPPKTKDTSLVAFHTILERTKDFTPAMFMRHIDHYQSSGDRPLRALALTIIGLHQTPTNSNLRLKAAKFANHQLTVSDLSAECLPIFKPNATLAQYYDPNPKL